jgi:hypothetical protein
MNKKIYNTGRYVKPVEFIPHTTNYLFKIYFYYIFSAFHGLYSIGYPIKILQ